MSLTWYTEGNSFLHRMSPVSKAVMVLGFWTFAFIFQSPAWNLGELLIIIIIILYAKVPLTSISTYLRIILPVMLIFLILFSFFQDGGTVYLKYSLVTITSGGIEAGIVGSSRLGTLFFSTIGILFTTTREGELVKGLVKVGLPFKAAFLIMMSIRFVSLSMADLSIIREARKARALPEKENLVQFVKNLISIVIPLFLTTIRRIQISSNAIEVKGFLTAASAYKREKLSRSELLSIFLGLTLVIGFAFLRVWYRFFI